MGQQVAQRLGRALTLTLAVALVGAVAAPAAASGVKIVPVSVTFTATGNVLIGNDGLNLFGGGDLAGLTYTTVYTLPYLPNGIEKVVGPGGAVESLIAPAPGPGDPLATASIMINGHEVTQTGVAAIDNAYQALSGEPAFDVRSAQFSSTGSGFSGVNFSNGIIRAPSEWVGDPSRLNLLQANTVFGAGAFGTHHQVNNFNFTGPLSLRTWGTLSVDSIASTFVTTTVVVPEPSVWAMLLVGFGAIGAALRRRACASRVI